ncbi:hypothetical protein [Candidatus Ichthyocystis hellenicum]|uniref:hypothetical protein n=1 Tax=Candidatus Ichthyocystis hellenicum TaxID=1561003 RepID=UPI000B81FC97|nr:hypothetical protein [Candidatus Ichthyocystis hellenicum]
MINSQITTVREGAPCAAGGDGGACVYGNDKNGLSTVQNHHNHDEDGHGYPAMRRDDNGGTGLALSSGQHIGFDRESIEGDKCPLLPQSGNRCENHSEKLQISLPRLLGSTKTPRDTVVVAASILLLLIIVAAIITAVLFYMRIIHIPGMSNNLFLRVAVSVGCSIMILSLLAGIALALIIGRSRGEISGYRSCIKSTSKVMRRVAEKEKLLAEKEKLLAEESEKNDRMLKDIADKQFQVNRRIEDLENKQKDLEFREGRTLGIREIDDILRASTEAFERARNELEMETDRARVCRVSFLADLGESKNMEGMKKSARELICNIERREFTISRMEPCMVAHVERNHALMMKEQSVNHREREVALREAELARRERIQ